MKLPTVSLGPFAVADLDRPTLLDVITSLLNKPGRRSPVVMFSLHVGGLNMRDDQQFVTALQTADLVVADGISVAALAKLAGSSGMHRHPTTDAGWDILRTVHDQLGRDVRVALIGGPAGLADRAAEHIPQHAPATVVFTDHGYHQDWEPVLEKLVAALPDVTIIGMGMPVEALWTVENLPTLPGSLVLTCGGWFGHIVGDEKRAPTWMRRAGLEWVARLAQQPGRLWKRYATGLWSVIAMTPAALRSRRQTPHT